MASTGDYIRLYVKQKKRVFPLMEDAIREPLPKDLTHGEAIQLYIDLLNSDPEFVYQLNELLEGYKNAQDPVTSIAEGVGSIFDFFSAGKKVDIAEIQAKAQNDAYMYEIILQSQKKDDTKKLLMLTGISVLAIGGIIFLVVKSKK